MRQAISLLATAALLLSSCRKVDAPPDPARLVAEMRGPDEARRGVARLQLITLGETAVPALLDLLRTGGPEDRLAAANTFWGMGPRAAAAVGDLVALLVDPDPRLRVAAAQALEAVGPAAAPAVDVLENGGSQGAGGDRTRGPRRAAGARPPAAPRLLARGGGGRA